MANPLPSANTSLAKRRETSPAESLGAINGAIATNASSCGALQAIREAKGNGTWLRSRSERRRSEYDCPTAARLPFSTASPQSSAPQAHTLIGALLHGVKKACAAR